MKLSNRNDGRPSMQFYVNDWLADSELSVCSLAAQGLWMHMCCRMWTSPERGRLLKQNSSKVTSKELAKWTGEDKATIDLLIQELLSEGAASIDEHGVIYCRRMIRDQKLRRIRSDAGRLGGAPKNNQNASKAQAKTTPSSSSSSSTTTSTSTSVKSKSRSTQSLPGMSENLSSRFAKLMANWNKLPTSFPKCNEATKGRVKAFGVRVKDPDWAKKAVEALKAMHNGQCAFLSGENDRGWIADIDWFLKEKSVHKILEGSYKGKARPLNSRRVQATTEEEWDVEDDRHRAQGRLME